MFSLGGNMQKKHFQYNEKFPLIFRRGDMYVYDIECNCKIIGEKANGRYLRFFFM